MEEREDELGVEEGMLDGSMSSEERGYDRFRGNDEQGGGGIGTDGVVRTGGGWMRRHARYAGFLRLLVHSQVRGHRLELSIEVPSSRWL